MCNLSILLVYKYKRLWSTASAFELSWCDGCSGLISGWRNRPDSIGTDYLVIMRVVCGLIRKGCTSKTWEMKRHELSCCDMKRLTVLMGCDGDMARVQTVLLRNENNQTVVVWLWRDLESVGTVCRGITLERLGISWYSLSWYKVGETWNQLVQSVEVYRWRDLESVQTVVVWRWRDLGSAGTVCRGIKLERLEISWYSLSWYIVGETWNQYRLSWYDVGETDLKSVETVLVWREA